MMDIQFSDHLPILLMVIVAYLLGSIPTALWAGKWWYGLDIREHGSGNAGATNAMRVLGPILGSAVLLIDALKGIAAVSLALVVNTGFLSAGWFVVYQLLLGGMAVLGHVFPLFASFKGGKGIATLIGITFILFPEAFLICLVIFLAVFFSTRYVSLGSMAAAVALPIVVIWVKEVTLLPKIIFTIAVALFVPITHLNNIRRLLQGKENRISFKK